MQICIDTNDEGATTTVGLVDVNDMETVLGILSPKTPPHELRKRVSEATKDSFGMADYEEFRHWISENDVRLLFRMFDIDGNGSIDGKELQAIFNVLHPEWTPENVHKILQEADLNGDGRIDYDEFLTWTYKQARQAQNDDSCEGYPAMGDGEEVMQASPIPERQDQVDLLQWARTNSPELRQDGRMSPGPKTPVRSSSRQLDCGFKLDDVTDLANRICALDQSVDFEKAQQLVENAQRSLVVYPAQ